jgi:hypothetical protein
MNNLRTVAPGYRVKHQLADGSWEPVGPEYDSREYALERALSLQGWNPNDKYTVVTVTRKVWAY